MDTDQKIVNQQDKGSFSNHLESDRCVSARSVAESVVRNMDNQPEKELIDLSHAWDVAMITNDADAIGRYMADDWTIIGSDGGVGDKATFLDLVRSGALTHDVMESHDLNVRVYGDTAVVIARGISGGNYQGQKFYLVERVSCVFVRQEGRWRCVLTHLSQLPQPGE